MGLNVHFTCVFNRPKHSDRLLARCALLLCTLVITACGQRTPDGGDREIAAVTNLSGPGAEHFTRVCSSCHEVDGGGKPALGAPALTNLQPWYVRRQLENFRAGVRGAHADDEEGAMMAVNAKTLGEEDIDQLVAHIDALPNANTPQTLSGDTRRGKDHYTNVCAACHSNDGSGNEALGAPALAGVNDWYLLRAYEKFRGGVRGAHSKDAYGVKMVRIAPVLEDEDLAEDVMTYVASLAPGGNGGE